MIEDISYIYCCVFHDFFDQEPESQVYYKFIRIIDIEDVFRWNDIFHINSRT